MQLNRLSSITAFIALALGGMLEQNLLPAKYAAYALIVLHLAQAVQKPALANTSIPSVTPAVPSATPPATLPPSTPPTEPK